jgi:protein-tyrosine phosphatase
MQNRTRAALELTGASNFRSLGGLSAADGRRIRPYALMRADRLSRLGDDEWSALGLIGLATVCDLRSDSERAEHPSTIPPQLAVRELLCEVRNDLRADPTLAALIAAEPSARGAERVMIEIYRRFPQHMGGTLRMIVERLLDGGAPLLVHCSAGKDRTGFVIAMLLTALDVPDELIRVDYLASRAWPGAALHRASLQGLLGRFVPAEELQSVVDTVLDVREAYLDAALQSLAAQFGTVQRYLESAAGLDAVRLDLLRARLLE